MKVDAKQKTVEELLGKEGNQEIFYKTPPYQREYSWKKNEWEEFFNDINENDKGYFLGSIICIYNAKKDDTKILEIIDGQQRLTTISILLSALYSYIKEYHKKHQEEGILDLTENEEYTSLWLKTKSSLIKNKKLKLELSIQNRNNEDYVYLLSKIKLLKSKKKPTDFEKRQISKAFEYFYTRIQSEFYNISDIFGFLEKVLSANIVKIEVDDIVSAFTLFESVNNRGKPLTPMDLIKNSIISKNKEINNVAPSKTNEEWQKIIKNIEKYADQVRFLRHYYHAFQCSNSKVKIDGFTKATKSNIMKIYPKHIQKDVGFIFKELIDKSKVYTVFINPEKLKEKDDYFNYKDILISLKHLGITPAYSLLLYLFVEEKDKDLSKVLDFVENWFIRRHITDYPATNKLDQIFLDLINLLCKSKKDSNSQNLESIIFDFLKSSDKYSSDEDFKKNLLTKDLYKNSDNYLLRVLLTKLESHKRTKENEQDFWKKENNKFVWTIEHIYPQKPNETSDWNTTCNGEDREKYLHKLGNLTLTRYNSNYSNNSYKDKIEIFDKNKKNNIGLKSGNVKINQYLIDNTDNENWCIKHIEERGKQLAEEIIEMMR